VIRYYGVSSNISEAMFFSCEIEMVLVNVRHDNQVIYRTLLKIAYFVYSCNYEVQYH